MTIFAWSEVYSVGVQELGEHHKYLFAIVNQLYSAMKAGKGSQELEAILKGLVEYTQYHFQFEEKVLRQAGYLEYRQHQQSHQGLTAQVNTFQKQFAGNSLGMSVQIAGFLKEWLVNHIQKEDKKYSEFLRGKSM